MQERDRSTEQPLLSEEEAREALLALLLAEDGFEDLTLPTIPVRSSGGAAPLSFAQERLWFLEQITPGLAAYTIPVALHISGPLQVPALSQSLNNIVRRHAALRTTFSILDDQPVQLIALPSDRPLALYDLRALPPAVRAEQAVDLTTREAARPFDLACGPLWRAQLLQIAEQDFCLLLTLHHIVADGWSMGLFYREMAQGYQALLNGQTPPLRELSIQYPDFAAWQRARVEEEAWQGHLAYWKEHLAQAPASLQLPTDRPRLVAPTYAGGVESLVLPAALTAALKALSLQEDATLFMTLLAAWQTLLMRISGQDDICVGTFIAGRTHAEIEGLIGFFLNNLALRTTLAGNPPFRHLLERVRRVTLDAYAHQELPFEKILQEIGWKHDPQTTPLFQVMLILQNMPEPLLEIPGLRIQEAGEWNTRAQFDLTLWAVEARDQIRMDLQYSCDLYDPPTIQRMLTHLHMLLQGIVDDPLCRLRDLPLLSAEEERQQRSAWRTERADPLAEQGLHHLFAAQVQRLPDAIALVWQEQHLTYAALNHLANRLARYLQGLGAGPETHIGVCLPRCAHFILGLLGILKAGGAHVSLDPSYPQERLALMMDARQVPILLTQRALLPTLPAYEGRVLCLDTLWPEIADESVADPEVRTLAGHLAYTIYTSGSTGIPKGVEIEHGSIVRFLAAACPAYACGPGERVLQFCSLSFDTSIEEIYICLSSGATLVLRTPEMLSSIAFFLTQCQQYGITVLDLPTAFWHEMVAHLEQRDQGMLAAWRLVLLGGERVEPAKVVRWQQQAPAHIQLVNTYGPTEATVISTLHTIEETPLPGPGFAIPLGKAIPDVRLAILDGGQRFAPPGVWGELAIGGANLGRGYLGQPALTAEKFIPDPLGMGARLYRSGDFARLLADGTLECAGRCDDQVKVRGFRVELSEIEYALQFHPAIADAVVRVFEQGGADKILVAYLVWRQPQATNIEEVRSYLAKLLPEYMLPSSFVVLDRLPMLPNVKVDYNALPPPEQALTSSASGLVAPRDALELQLVGLWEECLHVHPIGITDNFFELGGHSLLAVRLLSQIHRHFARQLPLAALLQQATIEQLAQLLRGQADGQSGSLLVGIQTQGDQRPLFLMHPTGGNVLCYAALAHHLGKHQPVYGLQAQGLEGEEGPLSSMTEMAHAYLQVIRTRQPEGPYLLGGWSSGGLLATEVAQQLQAQGQQVGLLILFDAPALFATVPAGLADGVAPPDDRAGALARFIFQLNEGRGRTIPQIAAELCQLTPEEMLHVAMEQAKRAHVIPAEAESAFLQRLIAVYDADSRATVAYRPQVYAGRMVYIQSEETPDETPRAWRQIAAGGLELLAASGDHVSMLKEPHIGLVAGHVRRCLAAVQETLTLRQSLPGLQVTLLL